MDARYVLSRAAKTWAATHAVKRNISHLVPGENIPCDSMLQIGTRDVGDMLGQKETEDSFVDVNTARRFQISGPDPGPIPAAKMARGKAPPGFDRTYFAMALAAI
jgi:hypothetical protein